MKLLKKIALACLVAGSLLLIPTKAFPQDAPAATTPNAELPDVPTLLKAVEDHAKELDKTLKDYIFRRKDEVITVEKDGRVKSTEVLEYEVHFEAGREINRLISKNGKPLSESEQKKEDESVAKHEKKAREAAATAKTDDNAITPAKFVEADRFYNLRRERLGEREVLAFDFEPRPDYRGHGMSAKVLTVLAGTIWIDEDAKEIVKLHAELRDGMKIAGGLVASVNKGAFLTFENERVNNEVWLPSAGEASFGYRVFFSRKNMRVKFHYSDYRKFRTESKITSVSEEVPAPKP